jgi:GTP-binding protein HflX
MNSGSHVPQTNADRPLAVVVGVQLPDVDDQGFQASLVELERLADTLGLKVIGRVTQRRPALAASTVFGAGKLKELGAFTGGSGVLQPYAAPGKQKREAAEAEAEADAEGGGDTASDVEDDEDGDPADTTPREVRARVVIVDHDLTPGQTRNLERATGAEVLDRSMVILSIFKRHARTREARIQVEIAQLAYLAPRLREASAGQDRQRGGIGGKGAGESALELDRRRIRDRIAELRKELEIVQREAETRRSRRSGLDTSTLALIGYTNAGKSSLMRGLTGDEVYVADQLFATLDTTVRALKPETRPRILVSDTVGFIHKLPHDLVASFRSTLAEAKDADLLLHVVDGSDPAFRDQLQVTLDVLGDIGAANNPRLLLLNKADRMEPELKAELEREFPDAVILSARSPQDIAMLHARIVAFFEAQMQEAEFVIPYNQQRQVQVLHERSRVLEERYDEAGARLRVRAPVEVLASLRREFAE